MVSLLRKDEGTSPCSIYLHSGLEGKAYERFLGFKIKILDPFLPFSRWILSIRPSSLNRN